MAKDFRHKEVEGMVIVADRSGHFTFHNDSVCVRMTSDETGASLSLCAGNIMIEIPLEFVSDIIKVAERSE